MESGAAAFAALGLSACEIRVEDRQGQGDGMCGICGIVKYEPIGQDDVSVVRRMNASLIHRGPNSEGELRAENVMLAMRRLSIIDLAGGTQPIFNEDKTIGVVANGEIYNFVELRQQLQGRGHHFATHSDCETIVHLYEEYGEHCVNHLRGMFAFALWDGRNERLVLARDRMGEKPLYLYETPEAILFSSEIKSILASGEVGFELDPTSVDLYFHYMYVPEPKTALQGVTCLPAAHTLVVDVKRRTRVVAQYWDMEDADPIETDPVETLATVLDEVAGLVIRADVPIGVSLSGGLDSSLVAALAVRKKGDVAAFTVGYPGQECCDERSAAAALAEHLGMPFFSVELNADDMVAHFPELNYQRDTPIADAAGYGYYAVMRRAREQGVPVILQGQGGDELFWGYDWMRDAVRQTQARIGVWQHPVWGKCRALGVVRPNLPAGWHPWQLRLWGQSGFGLPPAFEAWRSICNAGVGEYSFMGDLPIYREGDWIRTHYPGKFMERLDAQAARDIYMFHKPWARPDVQLTRLICDTYLRCNGIAQGDRLSMTSSVEMRLPLIDHRLVETVIGLRKHRPDGDLEPKAWLRAVARRYVPDWVMSRPKRGFSPPMQAWMASLRQRYGKSLEDGYLVSTGMFTGDGMRMLLAGAPNKGSTVPVLYRLLVLEYWAREMARRVS